MRDKVIKQIVDVLDKINGVLRLINEHISQQQEINKIQTDVLFDLEKRLAKVERSAKK